MHWGKGQGLLSVFEYSADAYLRQLGLSPNKDKRALTPPVTHLLRVGNPRLYDHPYHSPQLSLWIAGEVEWFIILRNDPPVRSRRPGGRIVLIQPPLFSENSSSRRE